MDPCEYREASDVAGLSVCGLVSGDGSGGLVLISSDVCYRCAVDVGPRPTADAVSALLAVSPVARAAAAVDPAPVLNPDVESDPCAARGRRLVSSRCGCVYQCEDAGRVAKGWATCTKYVCERCPDYR